MPPHTDTPNTTHHPDSEREEDTLVAHRFGLGSIGWLIGHCCRQFSFAFSERRRRENDATIQDMLKLMHNDVSAEQLEHQLTIRSIPINHDAQHANIVGVADRANSAIKIP